MFKTDVANFVYNSKYSYKGREKWPDTVLRVVNHVAQNEADYKKWVQEFYNIIYNRYFIPGGRILANAGTEIRNLMNCFYLDVEDSRQGIYETLKNAAEIFAHGGGIGYNFSQLREKGAYIKGTGGKASGPVSFMELFDKTGDVIEQASRRGAQMGILNDNHPDIIEFINSKSILSDKSKRFVDIVNRLHRARNKEELPEEIRKEISEVLRDTQMTHFNISVGISNRFMEAVKNDKEWELISTSTGKVVRKVKAKGLFKLIAQRAWESGDPGVLFLDRVNEDNIIPYYGELKGSNPCQFPDNINIDGNRIVRIGDLDKFKFTGEYTVVEDGISPIYEADTFYVWKTGHKKGIKLITNAGYEIKLTPDHKIQIENGEWIEAKDTLGKELKWGIRDYKEVLRTKNYNEKDLLLGFLFGDGFLHKGNEQVFVKLNPDIETEISEILQRHGFRKSSLEGNTVTFVLSKNKIWFDKKKFIQYTIDKRIPEDVFSWEIDKIRDFLSGLFEANGSINVNSQISFKTISLGLAKDVQKLLLLFGIPSWIVVNKPNKVQWHNGEYVSKQSYNLQISPRNAHKFIETIGFISERKLKNYRKNEKPYMSKLRVVSIEDAGYSDVYDFKMKDESKPWNYAEGLVCHNCGEIFLFDKEACNLGALNLPKFYDGNGGIDFSLLEYVIRIAVRFLDNVIDLSYTTIPEINETIRNLRRIGLGVMGWADLLAILEIPYNSKEAIELADRISWFITMIAIDESYKLGEEKGAFPLYNPEKVNFAFIEKIMNRYGINYNFNRPLRNVSWTALQPTGSIALLGEVNSGIEPFFALAYKKNISLGEDNTIKTVIIMNSVLEDKLREYGLSEEQINEVKEHVLENGTLRNAPHVPEKLQEVFVTAKELSPEEHINMLAAWQNNISNAVSKTINMPYEATPEDVEKAFMYMYDKRVKGGTIYRDKSKIFQVMN